jgi:hypothetical protein
MIAWRRDKQHYVTLWVHCLFSPALQTRQSLQCVINVWPAPLPSNGPCASSYLAQIVLPAAAPLLLRSLPYLGLGREGLLFP